MAGKSRLTDIYDCLKAAGFDVYFPTQHVGECSSPYVVVKDSGTSQYQQFSSVETLYEVLCYVPKARYSDLHPYKESVKSALKSLWPMIIYNRYETPPFFDDTADAHMTSIQYRNVQYSPR